MNGSIAVTGATGYVGRFVVDELLRRGRAVHALARPGSDRDGFVAPIEWVEGDLRSPDSLSALVGGAEAAIHLAYEHVPGRYRGGEGADLSAWLDANLTGSLRLLMAARDAGVKRFIFLSSRAVFSRTEPGRLLDESHPTAPDSHYGAYKAAVEAFLSSFAASGGTTTAALRATGVYGVTRPVERSKWWDIVRTVVGGGEVTSTRGGTEVHGADAARAVYALLERPDLGGVFHLSDLYVTHRDIVRLARRYAKRPGPLPAAPSAPVANPLACRRLRSLGLTLGGVPLLEATVAQLVQAAERDCEHIEPTPAAPASFSSG